MSQLSDSQREDILNSLDPGEWGSRRVLSRSLTADREGISLQGFYDGDFLAQKVINHIVQRDALAHGGIGEIGAQLIG